MVAVGKSKNKVNKERDQKDRDQKSTRKYLTRGRYWTLERDLTFAEFNLILT